MANFKLPFCNLLASTDRNHKETKLLPRYAADSNCLLLVNITGITTVKKNTFYGLYKLVLYYTVAVSNVQVSVLKFRNGRNKYSFRIYKYFTDIKLTRS
jgi:hypothetical protein